jgi:hypothetical protein
MQLTCPTCRQPIAAKEVNIQLGIGKCSACNSVFKLQDQLGSLLPSPDPKLPMLAPKHWRIDDFGPNLSITWRWYNHGVWLSSIAIIFGIFWLSVWNSITIPWFFGQDEIQWGLLAHLLAGLLPIFAVIYWAYRCAAILLNKTEVCLSGDKFTVYQGPVPVGGNRQLLASEIHQLYCTQTVIHGKGITYCYHLHALLISGERITLVGDFRDAFEPLFLKRVFEQRLKLNPLRVPGDWVA